ncbi:hypothetical protein [Pedobacter steynii]
MELEINELKRVNEILTAINTKRELKIQANNEAARAKIKTSKKLNEKVNLMSGKTITMPLESLNDDAIDFKGLNINEVYYLLDEAGYEVNDCVFNQEYDFEFFKLKLIDNAIVIEGNRKLVINAINSNVDSFISRKNIAA